MLPIEEYVEIAKTISEYEASKLLTSPHVGITTQMLILLTHIIRKQGGRQVICVKQNDLSVFFNYKSAIYKQSPGLVGYGTMNQSEFSSTRLPTLTKNEDKIDTPLVYMSSEALYERIVKLKPDNMHFCELLVIDDAFNGNLHTELIMYTWRTAYSMGYNVPRILFTGSVDGTIASFNVSIPRRSIPYKLPEIRYHSNDMVLYNEEFMLDTMIKTVITYNESFKIGQDEVDTWIVFLPSHRHVFDAALRLQHVQRADNPDTEIIKLHSLDITLKDVRSLRNCNIQGKRRIILTTHIGETISPDLPVPPSMIFDSLMKITDVNGVGKLQYISKRRAVQRASSALKLCYRMTTEDKYMTVLPDVEIPEILKMNLERISVSMIINSVDPIPMFKSIGISDQNITNTVNSLIGKNLLIPKGNEMIVSSIGKFMMKADMPVNISILTYKWIMEMNGPLNPILLFGALIGKNLFKWSIDVKDGDSHFQTRYNHYHEKYKKFEIEGNETNDMAIGLSVVTSAISTLGTYDLTKVPKKLAQFARLHDLDRRAMQDVSTLFIKWRKNIYDFLPQHEVTASTQFGVKQFIEKLRDLLFEVYKNETISNTDMNYYMSTAGRSYVWKPISMNTSLKPTKLVMFRYDIESSSNRKIRYHTSQCFSGNVVSGTYKPLEVRTCSKEERSKESKIGQRGVQRSNVVEELVEEDVNLYV